MHTRPLVSLARPLGIGDQCGTHGIRWSHIRSIAIRNHAFSLSELKQTKKNPNMLMRLIAFLIRGIPTQPASDGSS